ncbi:GAF domain-containing protein [Xanthocytophaga agilis]|uniref:GAF domain-containing protein n=1 Tax=Xanthocytophaga agilis TaxID=3048010 RepID=A0AAE3R729_9BACT|nr:GAF domain-containing protein [Xanthocytophaga agilis]MDJ1504831.1 GAF domain-containing protein [Xanthocytophaga agilis]
MSKKNYDSEFCGSLPLNFINHVQAYGILVVLEKTNLTIIQVSQNIEEKLGIAVEEVINSSWKKYVSAKELTLLEEHIQSDVIKKTSVSFSFTVPGRQTNCLAIVHIKDSYLILEIEILPEDESATTSFLSVYQDVKHVITWLESAQTITSACEIAITELKKISGFDRIMVYQFDENWNGTVIAETLEEGMEPYLGLVFPASDVPRQARALYLQNPYRQIPDREYTPVKLYPLLNPATETFIDLSDCNLRSVASVHIEYLRNMNVMSSMSIRIIKDNRLWGLIACHHRQAKFIPYQLCSVFELLSGFISSTFSRLQVLEEFQRNSHLQTIHARLAEQIYAEDSLVKGLLQKETTVLDLLQAEGAALTYSRGMATIGVTPDEDEVKNLIMWLQGNKPDKVFSTDSIASVYDNEKLSQDIAGMIAIPIHPAKDEYLFVFRSEAIQKINWGGNPDEAIQFEQDKKNYHPRNSFKIWQQTVKDTSLPWHTQEIQVADSLQHILLEYTLRKSVV